MTEHPITPPPELALQWINEYLNEHPEGVDVEVLVVNAAQWGADQELEACCEWLDRNNQWARVDIDELRDGRRPKPPSLKEQALDDFNGLMQELDGAGAYSNCANRIRRALEALPDD